MSNATGWIGVDLDGTLALYDHWRGEEHIGEPIPAMADRVRQWLKDGVEVRIFTARAGQPAENFNVGRALIVIEDWCVKHLGQKLKITCQKDYAMIALWDDRCVQVIPNTGTPVADYGVELALKGKQIEEIMVVCPKCANGWTHKL